MVVANGPPTRPAPASATAISLLPNGDFVLPDVEIGELAVCHLGTRRWSGGVDLKLFMTRFLFHNSGLAGFALNGVFIGLQVDVWSGFTRQCTEALTGPLHVDETSSVMSVSDANDSPHHRCSVRLGQSRSHSSRM